MDARIYGGEHMIPFWRAVPSTEIEIREDLEKILSSGYISSGREGGPWVKKVESWLCSYTGKKYAIATNSATSAMQIVLSHPMYSGTTIYMPAFTFFSAAEAAFWNNLDVHFIDVDRETFVVSPDIISQQISDIGWGKKIAFFLPNMFGNPLKHEKIARMCSQLSIPLLIDNAQGIGSKFNGANAPCGDVGFFSFSPSKLVTGGEGGCIVTDNEELALYCRMLRHHGDNGSYNPSYIGMNAKMTEIQALLICHGLDKLEEIVQQQLHRASLYMNNLRHPDIVFQKRQPNGRCTWKEMTILVPDDKRDLIVQSLSNADIETRMYWSIPLHKVAAYQPISTHGYLENTEYLADRVISLPMHKMITEEDIEKICSIIKGAIG